MDIMKIDWDKQISKQIENIKLSDDVQKLLALVYNSIMGNFDHSESRRIVKMRPDSYKVIIPKKEFLKVIGENAFGEIDVLYFSLFHALNFTYGEPTGEENCGSFNIISGISLSEKQVTIDVVNWFVPLMQRYIGKLVKPEYIEFLPLSEVFSV